jgi:hypothetical protein
MLSGLATAGTFQIVLAHYRIFQASLQGHQLFPALLRYEGIAVDNRYLAYAGMRWYMGEISRMFEIPA